jgi:formate dehydrogenase major subunit
MRLIQWHEKAVKPPGDVTSDAEFFCSLARRLQKLYAGSKKERDKGFLAASFTYGDDPKEPDMQLVLKEINGFATEEIKDKDGKVVYKKGQPLNTFAHMTDDGKTAGGCWIYTGVTVEGPDGKLINKANLRKPADDKDYLAHGWGFAWPANRRILYNRASADLKGKPWSEKKKLIWWDPEAPGQKPEEKGKWVGLDVPDFNAFLAPDAKNGDKPFIMRADLVGAFFGPLNDGPFPEHYEPLECPVEKNYMNAQRMNPTAPVWGGKADAFATCDPRYPYVGTSYRVSEHWQTGLMTRPQAWLLELQPQMFVELSEELAALKQIQNGQRVKAVSARGAVECTAIVTKRFKPFKLGDLIVHEVGFPWHYGWRWPATGKEESINLLTPSTGDPNTRIPETKAFMVNIVKI